MAEMVRARHVEEPASEGGIVEIIQEQLRPAEV